MNKFKKPELKEHLLRANPLVNMGFSILTVSVADKSVFKTDNDGIHLPNEYIMEKETSTRVYTKSEHRLFITQLSDKSKSLYLWLLYEIEPGKDYLWINKERYKQESKTSDNTYRAAIEELVNNLVLAPSLVRNVYWINPRLFFSGNRVNKYPNHVEVYKPKTK